MKDYKLKLNERFVYYKSIKRELKKTKRFTRISYTGRVYLDRCLLKKKNRETVEF